MTPTNLLPVAGAALLQLQAPLRATASSLADSFASTFERLAGDAGDVENEGPPGNDDSRRLQAQRTLADRLALSDGDVSSLDDLRSEVSARLSRIHQRLAAHGVDLARRFELSISADGSIQVHGDHPQRQQIEFLLGEDAELRDEIAASHAALDLLRAAEEHRDFARHYQRDPRDAVAAYASIFSSPAPPIRLEVDAFDIRADGKWQP